MVVSAGATLPTRPVDRVASSGKARVLANLNPVSRTSTSSNFLPAFPHRALPSTRIVCEDRPKRGALVPACRARPPRGAVRRVASMTWPSRRSLEPRPLHQMIEPALSGRRPACGAQNEACELLRSGTPSLPAAERRPFSLLAVSRCPDERSNSEPMWLWRPSAKGS